MEKNGDLVQKANVVVRMVHVVLLQNSVHFLKDVNRNLVNVLKEDVENYGDHVLKENVVMNKDTVVLHLNIVLLLKDVKVNMENVQ